MALEKNLLVVPTESVKPVNLSDSELCRLNAGQVILVITLICSVFSCTNTAVKQQFYDNGNIELEYEFDKSTGFKNGFYKVYSESGQLKYVGTYDYGLRTGWHTLFYDNERPNQKSFWEKRFERELASRKHKYDEQGHLIADFTFSEKQISVNVLHGTSLNIDDTIIVVLKIENAEHPFSEAAIGEFDDNLNVLQYLDQTPVFFQGNQNHEIRCKLRFNNPGVDTLKWLIRDYGIRINDDSTQTTFGTETYFEHAIAVGK